MTQQMQPIMMEGQALEPVASAVLHPWLALAEQAVADAELYAAGEALQAVLWERSAVWWSQRALGWLLPDCPLWNVEQALCSLLAAQADIERASAAWETAVSWLLEHGEPSRMTLYHSLLEHAGVQRQRLQQKAAQVGHSVDWVSSTWGIAPSALPAQA